MIIGGQSVLAGGSGITEGNERAQFVIARLREHNVHDREIEQSEEKKENSQPTMEPTTPH